MALDTGLIAHWPLISDDRNHTGYSLTAESRAVSYGDCDGRAAAHFNGTDSAIKIADHPSMQSGAGDFSISLWLHTRDSASGGDVIGDLINKFDHDAKRGFNLGVQTTTGVTQTTQSNYRHLQFGIDNAQLDSAWTDCGQPGNAVKISAMASIQGNLYVGTFENAPQHVGHLWRYLGNQQWEDMGAAPEKCNSVGSVTIHNGELYCSTGRYDPNGSHLGDAQNTNPGGKVHRIENGNWVDCGHPALEGALSDDAVASENDNYTRRADEAICLTSYRGELFCVSHHRKGFHRYLGGDQWVCVGPDLRIMSATIHQLVNEQTAKVVKHHHTPTTTAQRSALRRKIERVIRLPDYQVRSGGITGGHCQLKIGPWHIPISVRAKQGGSAELIITDAGRASRVKDKLDSRRSVYVPDLLGFGENHQPTQILRLLNTAGHRHLGILVAQTIACARFAAKHSKTERIHLVAEGVNNGFISGAVTAVSSLIVAALRPQLFHSLTITGTSISSLRRLVDWPIDYAQAKPLFCFGLLAVTDLPQIESLLEDVLLLKPNRAVIPVRLKGNK